MGLHGKGLALILAGMKKPGAGDDDDSNPIKGFFESGSDGDWKSAQKYLKIAVKQCSSSADDDEEDEPSGDDEDDSKPY
jgi:hypothetical protein